MVQKDTNKTATLTADYNISSLTFNLVSQPQHGKLNLEANGSFTYIPNPDFSGTDSFSYKTNNGIEKM